MKTNKILMTMALAAGFTACTSEELVESTQTNALENRKVLGDIEVVMGGADSRFALEDGSWAFNDGDAFGAALVDVFNGGKDANAIKNYSLTNYIQTNYQYAKGEGNVWTTPARMVEGNYVFYAPYNPNHLSRKPIEVVTPLAQVLDVNDGVVDPYSTINNLLKAENPNPMFVAYQFLPAEGQATSISVDMKHIFAYPEVTFANKSKEDVEIFKFVIVTEDAFAVKAPLSIYTSTTSNLANASAGGVVGSLYNYGAETTTNAYGAWVNKNVKKGLAGETADLLNVTGAPQSNLIVVEIPEGLKVEAGESASFNVVMPAMEYDGYKVYAYTSDEEGYIIDNSTKSATFYPGKRYPKEEYNNGNLVASKAGKLMTASIDKDSELVTLDENFPVVVSTTDELLAAVKNCTGNLTAIVTNEAVAINESVIDEMRQNGNTLTIEGDVTIEGGATAAAALTIEENIVCENNAIIEGYVTLKAGTYAEVEVLEGSDLTVDGATVATINNYGTATVKTGSAAINNYGTLNVATNNGNITVKYVDGVTTSIVNVKADLTFAKDIEGTWNVDSGKTLTLSAAKSLKGSLTVNGAMSGADLTVKAAKGLASTLSVNGTLRNNVKLDGHKAVATDTEDADKLATMEINSSAKIYGSIAGTDNMYDYNKVTIADGAFFVSQSDMIDIADVKAVYDYSGNITKKTDVETLVAKVPAQANTIVLDDILPTQNLTFSFASKYVNVNEILGTSSHEVDFTAAKLTATNIVLAGSSKFTMTGDLKVTGNLEVAKETTFTFGAYNLELTDIISGIKATDGKVGLDLTKATSTTISGKIEATDNIVLGAKKLYLKGSSIDMNGHNLLVCPTVADVEIHVESNLTVKNAWVSGVALTGAVSPTSIKVIVYSGKTLTINADAEVSGIATLPITFKATDLADHEATEAVEDAAYGKVNNKGAVWLAAEAYTEALAGDTDNTDNTKTWWKGNAAKTTAKP